jgi:hypothetical protein
MRVVRPKQTFTGDYPEQTFLERISVEKTHALDPVGLNLNTQPA